MGRLANGSGAFKSLAWVGGLLATVAALAVAAVLAVFATVTVVVLALMASATLAFAGLAMRAKRTAKARANADPNLIEARHMGGHSWVAYGWNDRA